jgi:hypothetical protein
MAAARILTGLQPMSNVRSTTETDIQTDPRLALARAW